MYKDVTPCSLCIHRVQVAIQLPMFNERAVCQAIIDCCCDMEWPATRLKIQVLDDSTDKVTRELVDEKVLEWRERGVNVDCIRRTNRQGYKAGAMKEGMDLLIAEGYQYVAVFDADFRPEPDFLERTIPYLEGNPKVGYVQSRWVFTNPEESYLTKAQEVSLNYHMKCEQFTHSAYGSFFNFNGTAGVWRAACIHDAGGWNARTTVEDMDLSLRAYLRGWTAIFLEDLTCLNELPASFFAYRKQQHRWTCGPIQLWSKASKDIWQSRLPVMRKIELISTYFGVRKCATHFVSLGFFCTVVPLTVFFPEVSIPLWALIHVPVVVTLVTSAFTPRGWAYCILYVLFENAMGTVKMWAVITGILDLKRAQEWVVTTKLGSSDKRPGTAIAAPSCKAYPGELGMSAFTLCAGFWALFSGYHFGMVTYLLLQGCVFMAFGLNWVDAGNLLGGRLDEGIFKLRIPVFGFSSSKPKGKKPGKVERAVTIPVIDLRFPPERLPLPNSLNGMAKAASARGALETTTSSILPLSSVSSFPKVQDVDVWRQEDANGSPTRSSGTRTPDSNYSAISTIDSDLSVPNAAAIKLGAVADNRSPTSSMVNIYATGPTGGRRQGYRFSNTGYYASDHSD